jgi:RNA polymerase sigma factor (sigma-70 family)
LGRAAALRTRLLSALAAYCGDRHVAEDVVQDVLLTACLQGEALEDIENLWRWMWRVAVNRTHSHYRRAVREVPVETVADRPSDGEMADEVAVRLLLAELDPRPRTAVWLRLFEQHTVAEAAARLGCPDGTLKSITCRAAARLRGRLAA